MFRLALKNIFYYKGRTITTFILSFIATFFFIIYVSIMDGSHNSILKNALKIYTGAIQVYAQGYRDQGGNDYLIEDVDTLRQKIVKVPGVKHLSSRYESYGLFSLKEFSTAAMIVGIQPKQELHLSQLKEALVEGHFLDKRGENCIYMGQGVVKKLHAKLDAKISFIGSSSDNGFAADIFILCGIFKTGSLDFDNAASFVSKDYLDTLMLTSNQASYLTISVNDLDDVQKIQADIENLLDDNYEVLTWRELMKAMVEMMAVDSVFGYISISLFFVVIFFVILIFGFINISSRVREFGTLRCIGLSKSNISWLLFYEIFIISSMAIVLATPIASAIAYHFSLNPIVIEGMSEMYQEYGIVSDELPFSFDLFTITWNVLIIYILNFLSIIYPMFYINKLKPIEAAKHV